MKLRCVKNSLRLRVKKSDLKLLNTEGIITETVAFGGQQLLAFALAISEMHAEVSAEFLDNLIIVQLPTDTAQAWINSNEVGIEVHNQLDNGESLHILVEKDFPCLDRENEDKSDTFFELATKKPDAC
ncbi:MAG: hypothetical protein AAGJ18_29155 [Bacteroidota bacterium]